MRIFQSFAAVLFVLLAFDVAAGCSCMRERSPCNYYGDASAIFLGRVVGAAQQNTSVDENGNKITYDVGTIRFLVQENFKGAPGYEVEIHSGTGGGDCGYWFLRNESYVVYAYRSKDSGELYTHICTRTRHVINAEEDLAYLRAQATTKPGASLSGRLVRLIGDPEHGPAEEGPKMVGVKVVVTGEGKTIETETNEKGEYSFKGLSPGNYDVAPQLPDSLAASSTQDRYDNFGRFTHREPVLLSDRGCTELPFVVQFNGVVSGKVADAAGVPVKEVQINLVTGDDNDKGWYTWTDHEGKYSFTKVHPGSYLLGFNLKWAPNKGDPYPKTYYPGVKTRFEASLITVGEGEKLKGYDMTLPPRLTERAVKLTVVWPDGRPATGATVRYEMNEATDFGTRVNADAKGQATLTLFDKHYYVIYARVETAGGTHSVPVEVFVDKSLKPLRLVLTKKGFGPSELDALKRPSKN